MKEPLLVLNVGWMKNYRGLTDDELTDGGAYVKEYAWGGEIFNFMPFQGVLYGYFQPPGQAPYNSRIIRIERLGADTDSSFVEGALIAWAARNPSGGTYLVGWYQNATVFREWQEPPEGSMRTFQGKRLGYYVRANESGCVLLNLKQRTLRIPRASDIENRGKGGIGQANLWYADSGQLNDLKFAEDFISLVNRYKLKQ